MALEKEDEVDDGGGDGYCCGQMVKETVGVGDFFVFVGEGQDEINQCQNEIPVNYGLSHYT